MLGVRFSLNDRELKQTRFLIFKERDPRTLIRLLKNAFDLHGWNIKKVIEIH